MKYPILAAFISCLAITSDAWIIGPTTGTARKCTTPARKTTACPSKLYSLATPSSSSSGNRNPQQLQEQEQQQQHDEQLASGRILEGGAVIDFSSVKASSHAEQALAQARLEVVEQLQHYTRNGIMSLTDATAAFNANINNNNNNNISQNHFSTTTTSTDTTPAILGINQEVVQEVGHALGQFATPPEIQACAAYLRSKAPVGLFQNMDDNNSNKNNNNNHWTLAQTQRYEQILQQAYDEAGEVTGAFAKTFYMGTMLLGEAARKAIWAIYVWCRRTDEIVDAPRENEQAMLRDLSFWELRLENLWTKGQVVDVYDLVLLDCLVQYPTLDITPFMDMIRGMLMDVPELGQDRYEKFDELHLYCYRVAGTVGLMSLPVFGCAPGFDDKVAREPALSLGVAFQLTNILRDVGEDAVQRGRVYLPQEDLRRFGVTEDQIFEQCVDDNYIELMKYEIARARMYYERARRGVFMLAPESRLPVQSSLDAYGRILDKIEENGYDSLTKRAYVDKWEKLFIIPFSWYRTLDISRQFPLPGDKPIESLELA